jgi:hypothetical protein
MYTQMLIYLLFALTGHDLVFVYFSRHIQNNVSKRGSGSFRNHINHHS